MENLCNVFKSIKDRIYSVQDILSILINDMLTNLVQYTLMFHLAEYHGCNSFRQGGGNSEQICASDYNPLSVNVGHSCKGVMSELFLI